MVTPLYEGNSCVSGSIRAVMELGGKLQTQKKGSLPGKNPEASLR
jgi:hypothetical protein